MGVESKVELGNPGEKENKESREQQFTHWTAVNNRVMFCVVERWRGASGLCGFACTACRPKAGSQVACVRGVEALSDPIRNSAWANTDDVRLRSSR